ncbi:hypothetical protein [Legionella sp. W05-934-2]|uniref:hypothetical protein n=1 Tax=Legionella sp. W05-934-2 TaxID=1198649 RepID=UPI003463765C
MKKICIGMLFCLLSLNATASQIVPQSQYATNSAVYPWSLSSPGELNLYKNISSKEVTFIYSTNTNSDTVVIRCPLNDIVLRANFTYICWLPPGESAKIELKPYYFSQGASGSYSIIF